MSTRQNILLTFCVIAVGVFAGCEKNTDQAPPDPKEETSQKQPAENLLIEPGIGVGDVKLGMTVDQMKDVLGKPDVAATGVSYMYKSLGIEVVVKDKQTISAISCGNPHNMTTPVVKALGPACRFRTAEGIGIGSAANEIIQTYGEPTKKSGDRLVYKEKKISFFLTDDKVIGIWLQQ